MPIRQEGILARRCSTCPRESFWRRTMAPRASRPIRWKLFLPMSVPRVAMDGSGALGMAQILVLGAPDEGCAGKHGRSIPLAEVRGQGQIECRLPLACQTIFVTM